MRWLCRKQLLQPVLKLFPDSRHSKELRWPRPQKSVNQRALQGIGFCEKHLAPIMDMVHYIEDGGSDV